MSYLRQSFNARSDADASFYLLKGTDIFCAAARRVGNDNELAALLPAGKFDAQDVALLEKCEFSSLAALVKLSVK